MAIDVQAIVSNKNVSPEIYLDYLYVSKERYKDYKLSCDNTKLIEQSKSITTQQMKDIGEFSENLKDLLERFNSWLV